MKDANTTSRRNFIKSITATTAAGTAMFMSGCDGIAAPGGNCSNKTSSFKKGSVILFQGDSITDASRNRGKENNANNSKALGNGYVYLIAAQLLAEQPANELKIYNRGISGNKVYELANRWDKDCLNLKPDVLSILIGVNDIWHTLKGRYDGTVEKYEKDYIALLDRTITALPDTKLVICEPFVLRCGAVNGKWFPEIDKYRAIAEKLARRFDTTFVPFQSMLDKAIQQAPPKYWLYDGVHPSVAGTRLMAQAWMDECC